MSYLEIDNACKKFEAVEVLRNISLEIDSGEFAVFVGPSGCGKSTLLRMIAGLETISSGEIRLDGKLINDVNPADRGIAMVFQNYALYPHMTVAENMAFSLRLAKVSRSVRDEKVKAAADILRLGALLERRPSQLSGGQKQRVAIGRAIVRDPKVFLFDEPLSNLDAELRVQMRAELAELHDRLKATMIYVTHDQVEAMTLADKMVVLNDGIIQQAGTPLELYDYPGNVFVGGFIGTPRMNFFQAKVTAVENGQTKLSIFEGEKGIICLPNQIPATSGDSVQIGLRPDHVVLCSPDEERSIPAKLDLVEELGNMTFLSGRLPNGNRIAVQHNGERIMKKGQVHFTFDASRALVFDSKGNRLVA